MPKFSHSLLEEYKTQASILLKQLRSSNIDTALKVASRFHELPHFQALSPQQLVESERVQLKHALDVIAREHHFNSWADFKKDFDRKERYRAYKQNKAQTYTIHYPERCSRFTNEWHVDYKIASTELGRTGGYLFPYHNQFFICQSEYIVELGLDPDDQDWKYIGWNWVQPIDQEAWKRLNTKLQHRSPHQS